MSFLRLAATHLVATMTNVWACLVFFFFFIAAQWRKPAKQWQGMGWLHAVSLGTYEIGIQCCGLWQLPDGLRRVGIPVLFIPMVKIPSRNFYNENSLNSTLNNVMCSVGLNTMLLPSVNLYQL